MCSVMVIMKMFRKLNISKPTAIYSFIGWVVVILALSAFSFGATLAKGTLLSVSGFIAVFCLVVNAWVLLLAVSHYGLLCAISALKEHEQSFNEYTDCVHKTMRELFDAQVEKEKRIKDLQKRIDELENK